MLIGSGRECAGALLRCAMRAAALISLHAGPGLNECAAQTTQVPPVQQRVDLFAGRTIECNFAPREMAVGDVDRDSVPDLAVTHDAEYVLSLFMGNGRQAFVRRADHASTWYPRDLMFTDIDADGDLDFAALDTQSSSLCVYRNSGGVLMPCVMFGSGISAEQMASGDVNGDGRTDFVVCGNQSRVAVLLNDGLGGFASTPYVAAASSVRVRLADMDRDGDLDAVLGFSNRVQVMQNDGTGVFSQGAIVTLGASGREVNVGDVDHDGWVDIVALEGGVVIRNLGTDGFGLPSKASSVTGGGNIRLVDVDGDGDLDSIGTGNATSGFVRVMFNNGSGVFDSWQDHPIEGAITYITANDVDGDGDQDVVASQNLLERVRVLYNDGSGDFRPTDGVQYAVAAGPSTTCTADLNGDGRIDLLCASSDQVVSVLLNTGSGFAPNVSIGVQGVLSFIQAADLDGDGDADAVLSNRAANSVAVLKNDGSGVSFTQTNLPSTSEPGCITLGDLDADGDVDIVVSGSNVLGISRNAGNATFTPFSSLAAVHMPFGTAIADVTGDGRSDILVAYPGASSVGVCVNRDGVNFASPIITPVDFRPSRVACADIDCDGDTDLVLGGARFSGPLLRGAVGVMLNDRNTGFAAPVIYEETAAADEMCIGDLDGDADIDVVTTSRDRPIVKVRFNDGTGTLSEAQEHLPGGWSVQLVDLDSDGNRDIVSTNTYFSQGRVSVLTNLRAAGPPPIGCAGDFDRDGKVTSADLVFFLGKFGRSAPAGSDAARADLNHDGAIDLRDLIDFIPLVGSICGD